MNDDTHDKLVNACIEYIKWNENFLYKNSDDAGIKARNCLSELRDQASIRRKEIQEQREEKKKTRKGKVGRPPTLHKADGKFAAKAK